MSSFGSIGDYEHCMKVLYLSYNNLPVHLKLCFLYMRFFKEDADIYVHELIGRWIAEGFIKPDNGKDLERIGKEYIKQLITRSLISGKPTEVFLSEDTVHEFRIHDLFRDLCIREYEKEQFINSPKIQYFVAGIDAEDTCFHCGVFFVKDAEAIKVLESVVIYLTSEVCSVAICRDCEIMYSELRRPKLVKVANTSRYGGSDFETKNKHFTQLGYAKVTCDSLKFFSPCMLPLIWNLQFLVLSIKSKSPIVLPLEIWEMPQLREIDSSKCVLSDPTDTSDMGEYFVILKNLRSLKKVCDFQCAKKILDRIPNLKILEIKYKDGLEDDMNLLHDALCDLIHLQKLEILSISNAALENAMFPNSLKCLILKRCKISRKEMKSIGSLPNLEELFLVESGEGTEWTPIEGEFLQLRWLAIQDSRLRCWNAEAVHFPKLEKLVLSECELLEEIPSGIGDIATLQSIYVEECNEHVEESAKEIRREQQSMGNESLKIIIDDDEYLGPEDDDGDEDEDDDNENDKDNSGEDDLGLVKAM